MQDATPIGRIESKIITTRKSDERGKDQGVLLGSGLIAGEGLMGVVIAVFAVAMSETPKFLEIHYSPEWIGEVVFFVIFGILGWFLYSVAAKSRKA
ncbi:MAG: hypothetical protein JSW07_18875 [bacterium]|nr:MAG: hypothetical protein JSW07_18875 [bacterium]